MKTPCSFNQWKECFCNTAPTMYNLRRGFITLLRYCFSDPNHYSDNREALGCLVYSDDDKEKTLSVDAKGIYDPSDTNSVPGVSVSMSQGIQFQRIGINDRRVTSRDFSVETDTSLATAQIQITCSHKDADVCCALADMCTLFFTAAKKHIQNAWGWVLQFDIVQQTEPTMKNQSESDSTARWYESVVAIQLIYEYSINIETESKRLKEFSIGSSVSNY